MLKRVAMVGQCGPDASYLRLAVSRAVKDSQIVAADEQEELEQVLKDGVDLLLINRQLDWGFPVSDGIALIQLIREKHPHLKLMLISNYPEAQQTAVDAGALPGFGKREIGSPRVTELLQSALSNQ